MTSKPTIPVPDKPDTPSLGLAFWTKPPENFSDVFRASVRNEAEGEKASKVATIRISGPIYDGWFGVSAKAVSKALDEIGDVDEIRARINSPGGDVTEAMEILNMFRAHKARVVAVVDGIAASAGSFLAAGCDETVMSPGTQMMVHDASGFCFGQAKDMRKTAEALDSYSNSIASVYAEATGGTVEDWRAVMLEETWYTAEEAVEAGLADRKGVVKDVGQTEEAEAEEPDALVFEDMVAAFNLSIFNYAGRDAAPKPPSASAVGSTHTEGGPAVAFSDEQLTTMRQKLGLPEDADEATIVSALDEALEERAEPPASPAPTPSADQPTPTPVATAPGTMVIDSSAWAAQQERIKRLEAVENKRRREERDDVVAQAVRDGKFANTSAEHYKRLWDQDPEGTRAVIDTLTKGVIPTNELGHGGFDDEYEADELAHHYPPKGA